MNFLEKNLEQIIYEADRKQLSERGLDDFGIFKRQLRIGNYGIADLVSIRRPYLDLYDSQIYKGVITVYELKKEDLSNDAFFQALGYLKGIKRYLDKRNKEHLYDFQIRLIGKSVNTSGSFCFLPDFLDGSNCQVIGFDTTTSLEIYTYDYNFNGISFTNHYGYKITNEGF